MFDFIESFLISDTPTEEDIDNFSIVLQLNACLQEQPDARVRNCCVIHLYELLGAYRRHRGELLDE
jgi:hypothetical protein